MTLHLQNRISNLKSLLRDHKVGQFIQKFDDITHLSGYNVVTCTVEGGIKLKFFLSINSDWIYINVFGKSKIPLRINGSVNKNIISSLKALLKESRNKPEIEDRLIPLLKFYVEVVEVVADDGKYKIPPSYESKIKEDVKLLTLSMNKHGMEAEMKRIFDGYSNISLK